MRSAEWEIVTRQKLISFCVGLAVYIQIGAAVKWAGWLGMVASVAWFIWRFVKALAGTPKGNTSRNEPDPEWRPSNP